jgi:hypothetical protein
MLKRFIIIIVVVLLLLGIVLYEMHLPIAILANRAYSAREISVEELLSRLEIAQGHLKRSLTMLLLEPANTPEGLLAKRALIDMKVLTQNIEDARSILSQDDSKKLGLICRQKKHQSKIR